MTENERRNRRLQRKADAANQKVMDQIPLFADQVPVRTVVDEYWHWRFIKAAVAEGLGELTERQLWRAWQERMLRELAAKHIDAADHAKLAAYRERTYPGSGTEYGPLFWIEVLSGTKRVVMALTCVPTGEVSASGIVKDRFVETDVWPRAGWAPPYTRDELRGMFQVAPPSGGMEEACETSS